MKLIAEWELTAFPPSANELQKTSYKNKVRYDTEEYKLFKDHAALELYEQGKPEVVILAGKALALVTVFHWSGWFRKDGEICQRKDVSNRYKAIEDAIFRHIELDDSYNIAPLPLKAKPIAGKDKLVRAYLYVVDTEVISIQHHWPSGRNLGGNNSALNP